MTERATIKKGDQVFINCHMCEYKVGECSVFKCRKRLIKLLAEREDECEEKENG